MNYNFQYKKPFFEIDCDESLIKKYIFKKAFIRYLKEYNVYQQFIKDYEFEKYKNVLSFIYVYLNDNQNSLNSFNFHIEKIGYVCYYSYYKYHFFSYTSYGNILRKWDDSEMPCIFYKKSFDKLYDIFKRKNNLLKLLINKFKRKNIFSN